MSTHRAPGAHAPAIAAAAASAALSALVLLRRPLVNNDGVFYLLAAEAFARDGLDAARAVYPWPFHSVLIAGLASVLGVSAETAAQVLGAALLAVASAAFVGVVRALGGDRRVQWLAAAVVIAHPWLNESRDHVVRDTGVWAFGLLALGALLALGGRLRAAPVLRWAACGLAAVLFRPDAAVLMAAAPVAIGLRGGLPRGRRLAVALLVLLPSAAAAAWGVATVFSDPRFEISTAHFRSAAAALAAAFPLPYGREYAPLLLAAGLAILPVVKTVKALGLAHAGLAGYGFARARPTDAFQRAALLATLAAAMLPLYVQAARLLFVESRYTVFATLVLSVFAAFGAAWLWARSRDLSALVGAALVATFLTSLPLGQPNGAHVREAAAWIRAHGGGARLHTNSLQVAYLSGAPVDWRLVQLANVNGPIDGTIQEPGDLWAVRVGPEGWPHRGRLQAMRLYTPRASFEGPGGDAVLVYACTGAAGCVAGH